MNIKRNLIGASALLLTALATSVAASTVSLSGPATVADGESFQLQLFGNFDDVGGLGAGGLDLIWDDSVFRLDGFTQALAPDPAFSCPGNASCTPVPETSPALIGFGSFSALIAAGAGNTLIGTFDLTAISSPGSSVFTMVDNPSFFGSWLDATTNPVASPSFSGTSVSVAAVPVPAAVWLFGSGLLGLVGVARRRKVA